MITHLKNTFPWNYFLFIILALKALLVYFFVIYSGIGLGPDEAQYWTWSQEPDWGYYSKPPGIAWQIWLGTHLFGQTEWGVRSVSVLLSAVQVYLVYRLALSAGLFSRTAFWCALIMALTPLGFAGSFFAITDMGFLLCWTGACLTVVDALRRGEAPYPLHSAAWIIGGALFKWPIYLFWVFAFCARRWYFPEQKIRVFAVGVLISFIGLLPSIWWNGSHDWATFRHVFSTLQGGGSGHQAGGNPFEFIASQAMLFSPILFILLSYAFWKWLRERETLSPPLFFCGFVTIFSLGFACVLAAFQKLQGNWVIFAYPTGIIILGWYAFHKRSSIILPVKIGIGISLATLAFVLYLPLSYSNTSTVLPHKMNPLKHNMGWTALAPILEKYGYDPVYNFLIGDKYQTASILSFYGPGQKRAYFLNLHGIRNNQFSYWPQLQEEQKHRTGYFIWIENAPHLEGGWLTKRDEYLAELKQYFEKVEFLELAPLIYQGSVLVKAVMIFRCQNCIEAILNEPSHYW